LRWGVGAGCINLKYIHICITYMYRSGCYRMRYPVDNVNQQVNRFKTNVKVFIRYNNEGS